jgi:hypothetical protein
MSGLVRAIHSKKKLLLELKLYVVVHISVGDISVGDNQRSKVHVV